MNRSEEVDEAHTLRSVTESATGRTMTSSYNPPSSRLYPDLEEPQDEELQQVLKLSLITAQEDEARRSRIRSNNSLSLGSATSCGSSSFPDLALATACHTKMNSEPAKKLAAPTTSVARPRPEINNKNLVSKDYLDCSVPVLPKPVVPVSRNAVAARVSDFAEREAAILSANISTLPSRPKIDSRTMPIPPRPVAWSRSSTPDPNLLAKPMSSTQGAKPDLLSSIPAIPIPPRPIRTRPDGPAPPSTVLRSHSVPPPLKNENQEVKASQQCDGPEADTLLIQLSPPPCRLQDFDVAALDPYCPRSVSPATTIAIPPRPIGFQLPASARPNPVPSSAYNSPGLGMAMPGSVKNPAYGLLWPPAVGPTTGQFSTATVDNSAEVMNRVVRTDSAESSTDDLMFFAESKDDPIYLSLEDFDPLFSMDDRKSITGQHPNSSGAYTKPLPARPTISNVPARPSEVSTNQEERSQPSVSDPVRGSSDYDELLDPFSLSDLTQSLERKRQKHNAEQELRKTLRKVTEVVKPTKVKESSYEMLELFHETADSEIEDFSQMVVSIKLENSVDNFLSNAGYVISPCTKHIFYYDLTVKVMVSGAFIVEPVIFTCDVHTMVEHIITHVLVMLNDDLGGSSADDYLLKVFGFSEYLINNSILADYEYVQQCLKLDKDIRFVLCESNTISRPFKRKPEDDKYPVFLPKMRLADSPANRVTRDKLNILMETFYKEVEKLRDATIQGAEKTHCKGVVQAVKAVCTIVHDIETVDIMKSLQRLNAVVLTHGHGSGSISSASPREREFVFVTEDSSTGYSTVQVVPENNQRKLDLVTMLDDLHIALDEVTKSVKSMIEMYCRTFHTDFNFESTKSVVRELRDASSLQESLIIHLATAHRIPQQWRQSGRHVEYRMKVSLYYGGQKLSDEIHSQPKSTAADGFQGTVIWDEWLQFDKVMCSLPRETKIIFELIGVRLVPSNNSDGHLKVNEALGWVAMQLYNQQFELVQGSQLLGLWLHGNANPCGTNGSNTENPNSVLIQVNLPKFDHIYVFPSCQDSLPSLKQDFQSLDAVDQQRLQAIIRKDVLTTLTNEERSLVWEKRYYLQSIPKALPCLLQAVPSWAPSNLSRIYAMIKEWAALDPLDGLQLLLPSFADTIVRSQAVGRLKELSHDELYDLLPQLVQALKFEHYHKSALATLLLVSAQSSVRIAHQLYWLLKDAADSVQYKKRYQLMFGALLSVAGGGMREEFQKQEDLVKMLAAIADKVKASKEKEAVLQLELHNMWDFLHHQTVRLPINPAVEVNGVDAKSCSFFTSFTCPLKLALKNIEAPAGNVYSMFKAGDDLRQDMLTLQMIRIMDQLWLQEGLNLKMMTFRCQPTGLKRGLVELLMESDTLRKIQMKHGHGLAGSFKERPIAEWLQVHNPTELDYQKAVENFTDSCAGYCVATYILGICDRHNDNIMIKHSGHIFHIDFAKYLGDAQKFGNFKRDRAPFVLTSDMVYVINGGDKTSQKFQHFIDLCCRAFNIIRKHSELFLTLFSLMTLSGIPGTTPEAPRYIQKVLLTERSDSEAVADFTKMIQTSLESVFTQLNFFLHNLAQIRFFGHEEGALLSFIPKTYSMETDGKIRSLEMHGIQKRYSPEKYYVYIVKIERENQRVPSFVMRRFSEFQELHRKLEMTFPLVQLPSLSGKRVIGRAHVRPVAENRKTEIEAFMKELLKLAPEVAQHDLLYTFFHPMLRDEQDISKCNLLKLKEPPVNNDALANRRIEGSVKLNLFYKQDTLTIMVMHVKDLGKTLSGEVPSPYVKLYLLPDLLKETKRKTRVAKNTFHPTYNEMLCYRMSLNQLKERTLQVTIWSYEPLKENEFLGAAHVKLSELDLTRECPAWHKLQMLHSMNLSS